MRAKGAAQGYTDFYKRNSYSRPSGETKSVGTPEARNPFKVSIEFGEGLKRFNPENDTDDEMMKARKAALRRRLKKMRKK